jgi:hypothetical protein
MIMTPDTLVTLEQRIRDLGLSMTVEPTDSNPNMDDDPKWHAQASHWKCTLRAGKRRMTITFSQGSGIHGEPTIDSVLDCLISDASSIDDAKTFESWAGEMGWDTDSRKAEKTFKIITRQAAKLRNLVGTESYNLLLWETERL